MPIFFHFGSPIIFFTQFLLNRFHLLAQEIFLLGLLHLLADPTADFLFNFQDFHFTADDFGQQIQTLPDVHRRQQFLFVFQLQRHMAKNHIGQPVRIFDQHHRGNRFRRHFFAQLAPLFKLMRQHPGLGSQFRRLANHHVFELLDFHLEIGFFTNKPCHFGPVQSFDQHPHRAARQFQKLLDFCHGSRLIDIAGLRFVVLGILLCGQHDHPILHHHLFERVNRFFAPHIQVDNHVREH